MVENNWGKGTLALTLWRPYWSARWRKKGLFSRSWASGLPPSSPRRSCQGCRSCRTAARASAAVRHIRRGELGGSPAALAEKWIVLPELSCRAAAELPLPELPDCRRSSPTLTAGLAPELRRQSDSSAGLPARQSHGKLTNKTSIFVSNIPASECANISAQCSSAGPQNLSYALIGGGWGNGRSYSNISYSYVGGAPELTRFQQCISYKNHVQTFFKVCMCVGAPKTQQPES